MRRVAGQEQPAVPHRLDDVAAHSGDALLEDRPLLERPALEADPQLELRPDLLVRPQRRVLVRRALEVVAGQLRRAQAEQREAALVRGVDELLDRRRDRGQDAEPAERILARELGEHAVGDARPADAVEAVAACDHVALELLPRALVGEREPRPVGLQVRHRDVADLEEQRPAAVQPRLDQILDHLGLPVDDDRLAGQLVEGDPVPLAVELELDPVVDDPLALHPPAHAGLRQQVGGPLLEHARANARLDVVAAAVLDHDRIDPLAVEQVGERQPGRPRADDPDLRAAHGQLCGP